MLTVAAVPLNLTVSFVVVVLKFVPMIVTLVPTPPEGGLKPVIVGAGKSVNVPVLVAVGEPNTATEMCPVVAPLGTVTPSCVAVAEVTVACVPLNLTTLADVVVLKLVPTTDTDAPIPADVGLKLETVGAVTVKLALLVPVPELPTVTAMVPVVVPEGTVATICVVVAEVIVAVVPWNLTVSLPMVALKFVPVIVTVVPMGPLEGEKPVTVGAVAQRDAHKNAVRSAAIRATMGRFEFRKSFGAKRPVFTTSPQFFERLTWPQRVAQVEPVATQIPAKVASSRARFNACRQLRTSCHPRQAPKNALRIN